MTPAVSCCGKKLSAGAKKERQMGTDAQTEQVSSRAGEQARAELKSQMPVCPAGHFVIGTPKVITILKWQFQRYDTFCHNCQRRYIVYRWKRLIDKCWKLWRYKTFPGTDNYTTAFKPPAEVLQQIDNFQEIASF